MSINSPDSLPEEDPQDAAAKPGTGAGKGKADGGIPGGKDGVGKGKADGGIPGGKDGVGISDGAEPNTFEPEEDPDAAAGAADD
ncbi:hypothetical protein [Paenarthrobacter sp. 22069]|uniref:hypothetical protein n=1 Tax=Paenarthrobacter sp. 22069 TaxID=3453864 RepID=UPI003F826955